MMWLNACGRCGGDVFIEEDMGDREFVCLQCGGRKTVGPVAMYRSSASASRTTTGNGISPRSIAA